MVKMYIFRILQSGHHEMNFNLLQDAFMHIIPEQFCAKMPQISRARILEDI